MMVLALMPMVAVVAGLGLWAAWQSGKDVGYRNAQREMQDEEEPTVYLRVQSKSNAEDEPCSSADTHLD